MNYFIFITLVLLGIIEIRYRPRIGQSKDFILLWYDNSYCIRRYIVLLKKGV